MLEKKTFGLARNNEQVLSGKRSVLFGGWGGGSVAVRSRHLSAPFQTRPLPVADGSLACEIVEATPVRFVARRALRQPRK